MNNRSPESAGFRPDFWIFELFDHYRRFSWWDVSKGRIWAPAVDEGTVLW
jgi:hypothetical protein